MTGKFERLIVGDKIEIKVIKNKNNRNHASQILDIMDENDYIISGPIYRSTIIPLHANEIIEVFYYKENIGRFMFKAEVIERETNNIYKLKVRQIGEVSKVQERNYFRLPQKINAIKKSKLQSENHEIIEENCIAEDISGGGVKILCNYKHEIGELIEVLIELNDEYIPVRGEIVRVQSSNSDYNLVIGVKFTEISKDSREEIIKYIFEEQRKLRKKGLI